MADWRIGESSAQTLRSLLGEDEECECVRARNWFYTHRTFFVVYSLGTVAFLALLVWQLAAHAISRYFYYFLMMLMFPILLGVTVFQGLRARSRETWVAVTSQRVIQYEDPETCLSVPFERILSCRTRRNWLLFTEEIELRVLPEREFHTTTISRQSPFKLEYIDGLMGDTALIERMISDRLADREEDDVEMGATPGGTLTEAF